MRDEQGRRRFEVEAMLAQVETDAQPVIAKLNASQPISADERSNMAVFLALAMVRTPDLIDSVKSAGASLVKFMAKTSFSNVAHAKESLRNKPGVSKSQETLEKEAQTLVEFTHRDEYDVTINHRFAVSSALQLFPAIAPILVARDWIVLHRDSAARSFLTSDAPVVLTVLEPHNTGFYGVGFASADAMVLFPLTLSSALIVFGDAGGLTHKTVGLDKIRNYNLMLGDRCQRYLFARDEALALSIARSLGLNNRKWVPKFRMS